MFLFLMAIGMTASFEEEVVIGANSIYAPNLSKNIVERTSNNPFDQLQLQFLEGVAEIALPALVNSIEAAKNDSKIDALFLDLGIIGGGRTDVFAIREAVLDFKESGKPVYAYGDYFTMQSYMVASAADSIFMQPTGSMEFSGMLTEMMFFKGTLDKLEIEPRVLKHGRYKSAGEPFSNTEMSEYNRKQNMELLQSFYKHYMAQIASSRNLDVATLDGMVNELKIRKAEDAVNMKLVDRLIHRDQMLEILAKASGKKGIDKVKLVDYPAYKSTIKNYNTSKERLAIIYADGEIMMGKGSDGTIGSETLSKAIREARLDKNVKAVVLRVNSPGGSALASDVILREVELTKKEKPVVVSMGGVAASGGYYIACKADKIYAQPNTVTGSIGVIGMLLGTEKFFENKLGITYDRLKIGKYADLGNPNREMTADEEQIIINMLDDIYIDFITHVAEGRGMDTSKVNSLGGGRVWTGEQALEHGLIDELGNLQDAISTAVALGGLTPGDYSTVEYPKLKSPLEEIFPGIQTRIKENIIKEELGSHYSVFKKLKQLDNYNGPLMLMPYDYN
ncbi:MAG: signal peptide peptidase SppA [Bacteroidetes bacterium]|nr:signal peptide peptidase SppA [Bacteroidota bacterium]